jgi:vacuolar-type H+-ATPase subunit F/Vma7
MKIAFILDKSSATCFKLAGIKEVYSANNAEEAEKKVNELLQDPDLLAIVIIDHLFRQIPTTIESIERRRRPILLSIPGTKGPFPIEPDPLAELIRRKVGIEVRL